MSASIRTRLQAAASQYTSVSQLSLQDVENAIDLINELRDCLNKLTAQIAGQAPTDPHAPDVRINDAFMKAMALLVRLDAEDHSSSAASFRSSSTASR
jgi:hypothetical protein